MLNLTRQEKQVILFLAFISLTGLGLNYLLKNQAIVKPVASFCRGLDKINLNKADKETLVVIPGIGEKLALRILEYRRQNGEFSCPEELKKIKGITDYRFEKLKDSVFVE